MYSTIEDIYKFERSLYGESVLGSEYINLMNTVQIDFGTYGWLYTNKPVFEGGPKVKALSFTGNMPGFRTGISRAISDKLVVIILSNSESTPIPHIGRNIYKILYS